MNYNLDLACKRKDGTINRKLKGKYKEQATSHAQFSLHTPIETNQPPLPWFLYSSIGRRIPSGQIRDNSAIVWKYMHLSYRERGSNIAIIREVLQMLPK